MVITRGASDDRQKITAMLGLCVRGPGLLEKIPRKYSFNKQNEINLPTYFGAELKRVYKAMNNCIMDLAKNKKEFQKIQKTSSLFAKILQNHAKDIGNFQNKTRGKNMGR